MISLVYGGAGSGKSKFAEELAFSYNSENLFYLATMKAFDFETERKILRHRKQRENKNFSTIECYSNLDEVDLPKNSTVLLECISNLVANEMYDEKEAKDDIYEKVNNDIKELVSKVENIIFVSNNIFSDGIKHDIETLKYMKNLSKINQYLASISDQVIEIVAGNPYYYK